MSDDYTDIFYTYTNIYFHIFFNLTTCILYPPCSYLYKISISQFNFKVKVIFMNKIHFVHYNVVAMIWWENIMTDDYYNEGDHLIKCCRGPPGAGRGRGGAGDSGRGAAAGGAGAARERR